MAHKTKSQLKDAILDLSIALNQKDAEIQSLKIALIDAADFVEEMRVRSRDFEWGEKMQKRIDGFIKTRRVIKEKDYDG